MGRESRVHHAKEMLDMYEREDEEVNVTTEEKSQLEKLEEKVNSLEVALSIFVGELNLKVDSNLIIDAINNSPEDARIKGSVFEITKDTLIEDGIIKP